MHFLFTCWNCLVSFAYILACIVNQHQNLMGGGGESTEDLKCGNIAYYVISYLYFRGCTLFMPWKDCYKQHSLYKHRHVIMEGIRNQEISILIGLSCIRLEPDNLSLLQYFKYSFPPKIPLKLSYLWHYATQHKPLHDQTISTFFDYLYIIA